MRFISGLIGIITLLSIAYLASENRKKINLRTVIGAFSIQAVFAVIVLYWEPGRVILQYLALGFSSIIDHGKSGVEFVFGNLAVPGEGWWVFATMVLAVIIFFSALISVLYYLKIMPLIINTLGWGIHKLLKSSKTESLSAAGNIFVGQTEAPLLVKPFLNTLTRSELFAIMVGGLASVAGSVMAGYALLGVDLKFLIAAAFMSAPGGLLMAKMIVPETDNPIEDINKILNDEELQGSKPVNVIDAAARGTTDGLNLFLNVSAMLIAFIGLVSVFDVFISSLGSLVGLSFLSFSWIVGKIFAPVAFIIGIPWSEVTHAGALLGDKLIFNEFVAFVNLADYINAVKAGLSDRSTVIMTFALCGFANISSIGIMIGGIGTMAPKLKPRISKMAVKAILAGTLSNLMSATLAGILIF